MRIGVALAGLLASSALSSAAHADKMDETLDVSLRLGGGWLELDELALEAAPLDEGPSIVSDAEPQLNGTGRAFFGVLRGNLTLSGFRFGLGTGVMSADGLSLRHGPLPAELVPGRLWGMP